MWPRTREPAEAEREVCEGVASPPRGHGLSSAVREKRGGQETANPRRSFESSLGVPAFLFCRARWVGHPPSTPSAVVRSAHGRLSQGALEAGPLWGGLSSSSGPTECESKEGSTRCCQGWSDTGRSGDMEDTHRRMAGIKEREARCRHEGRWRRKAGRDGGAQGAGIPAKQKETYKVRKSPAARVQGPGPGNVTELPASATVSGGAFVRGGWAAQAG